MNRLHIPVAAALACVAAIAGCADPDPDADVLVSVSFVSLREGQMERVAVNARPEGFTVDGDTTLGLPEGVVTDETTFVIAPSCDATFGGVSDKFVTVRDAEGTRSAVITVSLTDETGAACAARPIVWHETCGDTEQNSCDQPCRESRPDDASEDAIAIGHESVRVCVDARLQDDMRMVEAAELRIEPSTQAFGPVVTSGSVLSIPVYAADWLVGEYTIRFDALDGATRVAATVPLSVGSPGEIGVEVEVAQPVAAAEFARSAIPLTIHRFPGTNCDLRFGSIVPEQLHARLYWAGDPILESEGPTPDAVRDCTGDHERYVLGVVPRADADEVVTVPLLVADETTDITLAVTSRILDLDDMFVPDACKGPSSVMACAFSDDEGDLNDEYRILIASGANTCLVRMRNWRTGELAPVSSPEPLVSTMPLAIPGVPMALVGFGASGTRYTLGLGAQTNWSMSQDPSHPIVAGPGARPYRTNSFGPVDRYVSLSGRTVRFVGFDNKSLSVDLPLSGETVTAFEVIDTPNDPAVPAAGGEDLAVLVATSNGPSLRAYRVHWPVGSVVVTEESERPFHPGTPTLRRGADGGLIAIYEETLGSVTAYELTNRLDDLATHDGVRDAAVSPNGSDVFLGFSGGVQISTGSMNVTTELADPIRTGLGRGYGHPVATCHGVPADQPAAFAVRTETGYRVVQLSEQGTALKEEQP